MTLESTDPTLTVPAPPPTGLQQMPLAALRDYRRGLIDEEQRVSYWRRLVQGRLNLIREQKQGEPLSIRDLLRSLGSTATGHRRQQLLSVSAYDELPQLPGLEDLWTSAVDVTDEPATQRLVAELTDVEQRLSEYRRALHEGIDAATAELIVRYKADPNLCLELFPQDVR